MSVLTGPDAFACAVLEAVGIDPSEVRGFTFRFEAGDVATLSVDYTVWNPDRNRFDEFVRTYDVKATPK